MAGRIADRLRRQQALLCGRSEELASIASALDAPELPYCVLSVFGPGGVGKSTLLHAVAALCQERDIPSYSLDGASLDPTPEGFLSALDASGFDRNATRRQVLLLDGLELVQPLESWLRSTLVPGFADGTLTILAGRKPVGAIWRGDPAWNGLIRTLSLRNLPPADAKTFLVRRGVPDALHASILDSTHGYPLALTLSCDVFDQRGETALTNPQPAPDLVRGLIERFLDDTPTPDHRAVLEVAALLRVTTETALLEILGCDERHASDLFGWLSSLSLVETTSPGIAPHPVVRDALLADLRWRNPERWIDIHRKARAYYRARLSDASDREGQRLLWDYVYLHRDNPIVKGAFAWQDAGAYADVARPDEGKTLEGWVDRFEGQLAASRFRYWWAHPAASVTVFRGGETGEPLGFLMQLDLGRISDADRESDPAAAKAIDYIETTAPLRPGERATYFRFWMARDTYHGVSPVQSLVIVNTVRHYLSASRLAFTFFPVRSPEAWEPVFAYAEAKRCPEAESDADGFPVGLFCHDWRVQSPSEWLRVLGEKEVAGSAGSIRPASTPSVVVLSRPDFEAAVRAALKSLHREASLAESPLLRTRAVLDRMRDSEESPAQSVAALQNLLRETATSLQGHPKRDRAYRAVLHTYLRPARTQEKAAELLDLPFSTYRRHLAEGLELVCESLWRQEIGAELK